MHTRISSTILILSFLLSGTSTAQQLFAGGRQGVGFWLTKNGNGIGSLKYAPDNHFSWNKELFLRRHTTRWAYELGVTNYNMRYDRHHEKDGVRHHSDHRTRFVETNLSVQYDVTYPLVGYMFPALVKMKSFFGFTLTPRLAFEKISASEELPSGNRTSTDSRNTSFSLFIGMSYTHVIPISKNWSVTSSFNFRMQPMDKYLRDEGDFYEPNRQISVMTGVLYSL
jgi:hypothetical protein